jgi:hypothetical protein
MGTKGRGKGSHFTLSGFLMVVMVPRVSKRPNRGHSQAVGLRFRAQQLREGARSVRVGGRLLLGCLYRVRGDGGGLSGKNN